MNIYGLENKIRELKIKLQNSKDNYTKYELGNKISSLKTQVENLRKQRRKVG